MPNAAGTTFDRGIRMFLKGPNWTTRALRKGILLVQERTSPPAAMPTIPHQASLVRSKCHMLRLGILLLCLVGPERLNAQSDLQVVVTNVHGQSRVWMLPDAWRPVLDGERVALSGASAIRLADLLAIRQKRGVDTLGYHRVDLVFSFPSGKRTEQSFWLPDKYRRVEDCPRNGDFHVLDERTFIRAGSFTVKVAQ